MSDKQPKLKQTQGQRVAEVVTDGIATNANIINKYSSNATDEVAHFVDCKEAMQHRVDAIHKGDLSHLEGMLCAQAIALDHMFMHSALYVKDNIGKYPDAASKYMNMALKAQNQSRMTAETLAEIKNPRPYIQNNKAQYQQVNNGAAVEGKAQVDQYAQARTRTREKTIMSKNSKTANELLKHPPVGVLPNKALRAEGENLAKLKMPALEGKHYETVD